MQLIISHWSGPLVWASTLALVNRPRPHDSCFAANKTIHARDEKDNALAIIMAPTKVNASASTLDDYMVFLRTNTNYDLIFLKRFAEFTENVCFLRPAGVCCPTHLFGLIAVDPVTVKWGLHARQVDWGYRLCIRKEFRAIPCIYVGNVFRSRLVNQPS